MRRPPPSKTLAELILIEVRKGSDQNGRRYLELPGGTQRGQGDHVEIGVFPDTKSEGFGFFFHLTEAVEQFIDPPTRDVFGLPRASMANQQGARTIVERHRLSRRSDRAASPRRKDGAASLSISSGWRTPAGLLEASEIDIEMRRARQIRSDVVCPARWTECSASRYRVISARFS